MNLYSQLDLISLASLVFSLASFVLICILYAKILRSTHRRREETAEVLNHAVSKKVDEAVVKFLEEVFDSSKVKTDAEIRKFSEELLRLIHARSSELSAYVEKTQQEQVKQSQFYVANMLAKIEEDAKVYRDNKFKEIDSQVRQILLTAAREVIGRAISLSEHEDLVNKALERAKRDKLFS